MRFGLFGGASARRGVEAAESARGYHDFVDYHVEAEALGFYGSFVTEHHFTKIGQISATLNLLTWIAARTRRGRNSSIATIGGSAIWCRGTMPQRCSAAPRSPTTMPA